MNFETALRAQIAQRPRLGLRGRSILAVLDGRPSKARTRRLERMEAAAAAAVGKPVGAIDWSSVDWTKIFDVILAILTALLPLLA